MSSRVHASLFYHFVWTTKNRIPYIVSAIKKPLYDYMGRTILTKGWCLLAIGGIEDHVHILIQKNCPKDFISDIVCRIKSNSSKFVRDNFNSSFEWQRGYSVFTVDKVSCPRIKQYILSQEKHHKDMPFDKEFDLLLKRYGIK